MTVTKTISNGKEIYEFENVPADFVANFVANNIMDSLNTKSKNSIKSHVPAFAQYYIDVISNKLGTNAIPILRAIYNYNPGAFISLVLKTVALEVDMLHEGHIADEENIYVFDPSTSKIHLAPTEGIKRVAFKYFAAFRTKEDAIFGIKMTMAIKRFIFNEQ